MPNDSPDWAALTDVPPIKIADLVPANVGDLSVTEIPKLPASCTGVVVLVYDYVHAITLTVQGLASVYDYLLSLAIPAHGAGPYFTAVQGTVEQSIEVLIGDPLGFSFAGSPIASVYALGASGYQVVQAPPHQPLKVDASSGGAVSVTQGSNPWVEVEQAPATILGGSAAVGGATLITVPAGRTWRGSVQISNQTPGSSVQVQTAGAGVTPAAGTVLCGAQLAAGATASSDPSIAEVYVSAPAGNVVTLTTVVAGAPVFVATCNGRLL